MDVEGARCRVPGAAEDCPSGQSCGNDLRCSAAALACEGAGTRCEVGAAHCAGSDGKEKVERCSGELDPACGSWVVEDCEEAGLECGTRGPAAACECPAYAGTQLRADPLGGSLAGAAPFPTGATSPAPCRFGRLGEALGAAAALAAASGQAVSVQAFADAGEAVFGDVATGETFPLEVAADVSLAGGAAPAGPTVVRAEGATAAPLVHLQGSLADLRIESVPTVRSGGSLLAATGAGLAVTCGAPNRPWVAGVTLHGGGTLAKGIDVDLVAGACGATLAGVEVSGVDGPALSVVADPLAASRVHVLHGRFGDSARGMVAVGGKLTIGSAEGESVEVSGNAGEGIVLTGGASRTLDVELLRARVAGNGGTGVVLDLVSPASKLTVRGSTVYANGDASSRTYGAGELQRPAGGVFLSQGALAAFTFDGNRLSANAGDQLAFESDRPWSISTGACALANLFACVDAGSYAVGVAGGGTVDASFSVWPSIPWAPYAGPGVTAPSASYCNGAEGAPTPPAPGSCPAP